LRAFVMSAGAGTSTGERCTGSWRSGAAAPQKKPPQRREKPLRVTGSGQIVEVAALERELGRLKGRLELTERAESTLREQLDRERQRTELERQRAERLEAQLEEARRPWWRRLLGG
jgi:hypothetical protein